ESSERQAGLGEALAAANDGRLTPEAKKAFERAVELDAANIKARYFLGVAAEQEGRTAAAVEIWRNMLAAAPGEPPRAGFSRQDAARLAGSTGAREEDVAAASDLTEEQRVEIVRNMVARLVERVNRDGSDLEGWLRLVRSYMVLGERDKALAAVGDARRAL